MDFWDWGATESEDEPDNRVDKYTVCMEKDKKVVGQLKKGDSGKFAKTFSTSWEVIHTPAVLQQFQGKDAIWKTEKACRSRVNLIWQQQYVNILKQKLHKIKELQ